MGELYKNTHREVGLLNRLLLKCMKWRHLDGDVHSKHVIIKIDERWISGGYNLKDTPSDRLQENSENTKDFSD